MDIRTENLTILFVDIAGFTATTSRQSRLENAHLLQTFEKTLLPLIKRFKGNVVKSIGDALLITFRSPTDAMLCSMALQDAMHAHNLHASDDDKIHIRVAANLGEVRVTKKDIFGEPVNVASRIEGVTPADEIYLSEAVYMAMNKAEVPALEVGFKQLAGIPQAVRVYSIPRFATHRLVPQNQLPAEQGNELLFPYGGMHQRVPERTSSFRLPSDKPPNRYLLLTLAMVGAGTLAAIAVRWLDRTNEPTSAAVSPISERPVATTTTNDPNQTAGKSPQPVRAMTATLPAETPVLVPSSSQTPGTSTAPTQLLEKAPSATKSAESGVKAPAAATAEQKSASANKPVAEPTSSKVIASGSKKPSEPAKTSQPSEPVWSVTSAKTAYRVGQIDKAQYRAIVKRLELEYETKIRELKQAYRAGKISETEYETKVREAKRAYSGR